MAVVGKEPPRPSKLSPGIDPDLETICLKCLEKDPLARYGSAEALADDLERWLEGKPILARPTTPLERTWKWARRQPILAGAFSTVLATALALLILSGFLWQDAELRVQAVKSLGAARLQIAQVDSERQQAESRKSQAEKLADEQRKRAEQQKTLAEKITAEVQQLEKSATAAEEKLAAANTQLVDARKEARHTLYAADLQLAHVAWQDENITTASELLDRYRDQAGQEDVRGFEWHWLDRQVHAARLSWSASVDEKANPGSIVGMAVSPDGQTLATAQIGSPVRLWNLADGKLLRSIETRPSNIVGMSFTNFTGLFFEDDGRKLVVVLRKDFDMRQMDKMVNAAMAKKEKMKIESLADSLEFQVVTLAENGPAKPDAKAMVTTEKFDPARLKSAVFPVLAGGFFLVDEGRMLMVMSLDTTADGRFIALAGSETVVAGGDRSRPGGITGGRLVVWDLKEGKIHAQQPSPVPLTAVAFSPRGDALAIGTSDGAVGVGKPDLAQPPRLMVGHHGYVYALKFTADGSRLASGAMDGPVILWDVAAAKELNRLRGHISAVSRIELSPDGQSLISGGMNGTVKIWDWNRGPQPAVLGGHTNAVGSLVFAKNGGEIVSGDSSGVVKSWRVADGQNLSDGRVAMANSLWVRMSDSGQKLAWKAGIDRSLLVRDVAGGKETRLTWEGHVPFQCVFSPDEKMLAAADLEPGGLILWNLADGQVAATLVDFKGTTMDIKFSPDSRLVAAAQGNGIIVWDWQAGTSRRILDDHLGGTTAVAFSADSRLVAAAGGNAARQGETTVRIWDLAENRVVAELIGAGQQVRHLVFSPDGRRLATGGTTAGQRGMLKLWDTASGREVFSAVIPPAQITAVAFSPSGQHLAAGLTPYDVTATLTGRPVASDIYLWDATPRAAE